MPLEHVGEVYRRLEIVADEDLPGTSALRVAALVHEAPATSVPGVLRAAGLSDLAPKVRAVTTGFRRIWKARTEEDLRAYVAESGRHLASILRFELAHEGAPSPAMERAAEIGDLGAELEAWAGRLAREGGGDAAR